MENYATTTLKRIKAAFCENKRYVVCQGGMSAGKTFAIMILLISYAQSNPNKIITVVGMSYSHLDEGAIRDFKNIMKAAGVFDEARWHTTKTTYTFANDSVIEFKSLDKMAAHGPRRDVLFVNEANHMAYDTFEQLSSRSRKVSIIDYNPSSEFWAHTELLAKYPGETEFLVLTYKDNEALSDFERQAIELHKPEQGEEPSNWWVVYGLGQIGSLEGNVYSGWRKAEAGDYENTRLIRYGLDFGFENDETALVAIYQRENGELLLQEVIYEPKLLGSQYGDRFRQANVDPNVLIVADTARPELIAEIKGQGFRIIGADKNPGSVLRGIDRVSQHQIVYDGKNLEREYLSYAWRKKRTGEILDEPCDGNDHCMDALRYAIDDLSRPRFDF